VNEQPPPKPRSRTCPAKPEGRSRKIYILWAIALILLLSTGLLCWLVVVPFIQVRKIVERVARTKTGEYEEVKRMGPVVAARRLGLYFRMPESIAPEKLAALRMLSHCGQAGAPAIIEALDDEDREIRQAAAEQLPWSEVSAPALIRTLRDPDRLVRSCAATTLAGFGPPATPHLVRALGNSDPMVRKLAIRALGDSCASPKTTYVVMHLRDEIRTLLNDTDEEVRVEAKNGLESIELCIRDEREMAVEYGEKLAKEKVLEEKTLEHYGERELVALRLGMYIGLAEEPFEKKLQAVRALAYCGRYAVPVLTKALKNHDQRLRAQAAQALKKIKAAESAKASKSGA
jgi:HEAT repeats